MEIQKQVICDQCQFGENAMSEFVIFVIVVGALMEIFLYD